MADKFHPILVFVRHAKIFEILNYYKKDSGRLEY
jgi:hypothetical protein